MPYSNGAVRKQNINDLSSRGRIIFWLIIALIFVPACGFTAGMAGTAIFPALGKLAAPVVCNNGTFQSRQFTLSTSYSVNYSARFDCVVSQSGADYNVTTPVLYVNGLILAVAGGVAFSLILILIGASRLLTGRPLI